MQHGGRVPASVYPRPTRVVARRYFLRRPAVPIALSYPSFLWRPPLGEPGDAGGDIGGVLAGTDSDAGEVGGERCGGAGDIVRNIPGQVQHKVPAGCIGEPKFGGDGLCPFVQRVHDAIFSHGRACRPRPDPSALNCVRCRRRPAARRSPTRSHHSCGGLRRCRPVQHSSSRRDGELVAPQRPHAVHDQRVVPRICGCPHQRDRWVSCEVGSCPSTRPGNEQGVVRHRGSHGHDVRPCIVPDGEEVREAVLRQGLRQLLQRYRDAHYPRLARRQQPTAVCARCPVIAACRKHALNVHEPYGIWGGLSAEERSTLLRTRR